jgi:hypothetical protein
MKSLLVSFLAAFATARLDITDQLDFELGLRPRQTSTNLQVFTGALGGINADAITQSGDPGRPFEVGGDTFVSLGLFFLVSREGRADGLHHYRTTSRQQPTGHAIISTTLVLTRRIATRLPDLRWATVMGRTVSCNHSICVFSGEKKSMVGWLTAFGGCSGL